MAAKKPNLLIVDDEENVTRTLQMVFEQDGYSVVPAYSSRQAIELLHNGHSFDALITDLNMEHEDIGLEVARAAKELRPAPVVVIVTGYASVNNAREALGMHVDYYAQKPVDLGELKGAVGRLLRHRAENGRRA